MLPLWRKRLYVAFSPGRLGMLKLGRGLKPGLLAKHDEAIASVGRQTPWEAALDRFAMLLGEMEWQGAEVDIVLSNRLVRYATMVLDPQLKTYPARESFARYSLAQTYGAAAEQWVLRIQHGKPGSPALVSAVDGALLEGLRQACLAHKLKLNSIAPFLMSVFNRFSGTIRKDPAWLVIHEPGYSLLALLSGGGIVAVNGVPHDNLGELPILLDRENLAGTLAEPCKTVYLYASAGETPAATSAMGYEINRLYMAAPDGFPSFAEGSFAMIMSEAL